MEIIDNQKDNQIFEEFAGQLCEWAKTGTAPPVGNQDISYALALQKARLDRYHAKMVFELKKRGEWLDKIYSAVFAGPKYTNHLVWSGYHKTVNYFLDNQKRLTIKDDEQMYIIVTSLNHGNMRETYCCPNCGTINEINVLMEEGCPFCGTRFLMSDLFPKVTHFHFLRAYGKNNKETKSWALRWLLIGALAGIVLAFPHTAAKFLQAGNEGGALWGRMVAAVFSLIPSALFGAFGGYAVGAVSILVGLIRDGIRQAPMAAGQMKAKKHLTAFMKELDPTFSFEYFIGEVQALLKILIFTDDRSNLAVYEGAPMGDQFDNIIDAQYGGAISLNRCHVAEGYCYLDINIYMTNVYCQNNRVLRKSDVFQMVLCRNARRPVNYGFSIKKVSCKGCGASFDASKERHCPFCKSSYSLKEDDWVITYIQKK